jgi:hypothetical protein
VPGGGVVESAAAPPFGVDDVDDPWGVDEPEPAGAELLCVGAVEDAAGALVLEAPPPPAGRVERVGLWLFLGLWVAWSRAGPV